MGVDWNMRRSRQRRSWTTSLYEAGGTEQNVARALTATYVRSSTSFKSSRVSFDLFNRAVEHSARQDQRQW